MNLIAKLLPPANVVVGLEASSKKRAFEQAGLLFENNHGIGRSTVFDSLFAREKLGSTGLDALGAFMRLAEPVPFDAPDGRPVTMLFVLLVPEQANEHHLQLLSELAQMFSDRAFREQLMSAPDSLAVHGLFAGWGSDASDDGSPAV